MANETKQLKPAELMRIFESALEGQGIAFDDNHDSVYGSMSTVSISGVRFNVAIISLGEVREKRPNKLPIDFNVIPNK